MKKTKEIAFNKMQANKMYLVTKMDSEELYVIESFTGTKTEIVNYFKTDEDWENYKNEKNATEENYLAALYEGNGMYSCTHFVFEL